MPIRHGRRLLRGLTLAALVSAVLLVGCQPIKVGGATFPSPSTAGVPAGRTLRTWTGNYSSAGRSLPTTTIYGVKFKVIDGYRFDFKSSAKSFLVSDPYVVIKNSQFVSAGPTAAPSAMVVALATNKILVVDHSTFQGGNYFQRGVQSDTAELTVTNCSFQNNGESAIEKNDKTARSSLTVTDSYLSSTKGWPRGVHVDGIQVGGAKDITIRRNTVLNQPFGGANGDTSYVSNSALGLWAELGNVSGTVIVDRNLLAGGGRTIYVEQKSPYSFRGKVMITNNTFDTRFGPKAAVWGPLYPNRLPSQLTWTGNAFSDGRALSLASALHNYS